MGARAVLGVDVSVRRQMDAVLLDEHGTLIRCWSRQTPADIGLLLLEHRPVTVAIDAPPTWGESGSMRPGERALLNRGIHIFFTPSDAERIRRPFYDWMRTGHAVYEEAAQAGYPAFQDLTSVAGHALEAFPHAAAVALAGRFPPSAAIRRRSARRTWRAGVLTALGVETARLGTLDLIDAALAAITGLYALRGRAAFFGRPGFDAIVVPDPDGSRLATLSR